MERNIISVTMPYEFEIELDSSGDVIAVFLNSVDIMHALKKSEVAGLKHEVEFSKEFA